MKDSLQDVIFDSTMPPSWQKIADLWNASMNDRLRLDPRVWKECAYEHPLYRPGDIICAYDPFGNLIGVTIIRGPIPQSKHEEFWAYPGNSGWILMVFVSPRARNAGIGSRLVHLAEKELAHRGVRRISLTGGPGRIFPGPPVSDSAGSPSIFFGNRGYIPIKTVWDMELQIADIDLNIYEMTPLPRGIIQNKGLDIHNEGQYWIDFMDSHGWQRWRNQISIGNNSLFERMQVCRNQAEIVGFSLTRHSDDGILAPSLFFSQNSPFNVGGIGPIAVANSYRNHGLGSKLLLASIADLKTLGYGIAIADSTSVPHFYERFGFQQVRSYVRTNDKDLAC